MAAYISVPRDLTRVKSKVLFNLTKRQLLCFGAGALVGVPAFFLLKQSGNVSLAAIGMMIIMLPMFFLGMYENTGSRWKSLRNSLSKQNLFARKSGPIRPTITMRC